MQRDPSVDYEHLAVVAHHSPRCGGDLSHEVSSLRLQVNVQLLAVTAVAICSIVVSEDRWSSKNVAFLSFQVVCMVLASWKLRHLAKSWSEPPALSPVIVLLGVGQLAWIAIDQHFFDGGQPFEVTSMLVLRNIVLGLGAAGVWSRYQPICVVMSLFLSLFAATASQSHLAHALAGVFSVFTIAWLIVSYWETVSKRLVGRQRSSFPRAVLILPVLVIILLSFATSNPKVRSAIRGFLPSSGGERWRYDQARGGIGDGEMLVAGTERIRSFAPIDDAPFLQDDEPSMYDLFDDSYNEPVQTRTDRAVALAKELASNVAEHLHSRVEKANKEFSTLRRSEDMGVASNADSIHSDALFYVAGRVPLHLRMQAYDLFDGINWYPEPQLEQSPRILEMKQSHGRPWLALPDRSEQREFLGSAETHAIKVVGLNSTVIPQPLYTHGIHIDLVERSDLFERTHSGLIAMNRDQLPRLTPIYLASRTVDRSKLEESSLHFKTSDTRALDHIFQEVDRTRIERLARKITTDAKSHWDHIEMIEQFMRRNYVRTSATSGDSGQGLPVERFLFEEKAGPDYLFATATVLLLRSLNYPARVVSGFYVDPKKFDFESDHTPVHGSDVHFWTEVCVGGDDWLTVEGTPGFEILGPPPTWFQSFINCFQKLQAWLYQHWVSAVGTTIGLAFAAAYRIEITDYIDLLWLRITLPRDASQRVLAIVSFLQRRASRTGNSRPRSMTINKWIGLLQHSAAVDVQKPLTQLQQHTDIVVFGRSGIQSESGLDCKQLTNRLSLSWFRELGEKREFSTH